MSGANFSRRRQAQAVIWFQRMNAGALTERERRHWESWRSNAENRRAFASVVSLWKTMEHLPRVEPGRSRTSSRQYGKAARSSVAQPMVATTNRDDLAIRSRRRSIGVPIAATIVAGWAAVVTFQGIRLAATDPQNDTPNRQDEVVGRSAVPSIVSSGQINTGDGSSQSESEPSDRGAALSINRMPGSHPEAQTAQSLPTRDVEHLPTVVLMPPEDPGEPSAPAEPRHLYLDDGSVVTQSPGTKVEYEFAANRRSIRLIEGEALFRVAEDPSRPFVVTTASAEIRAVGTRFSIRTQSAWTKVTVAEGKVAVVRAGERAPPVVVLANEETVVIKGLGTSPPTRIDAARKLAWAKGKLVFESEPIETAIAEFNRQSSSRLQIAGEVPAGLRISGTFALTDPEGFAESVNSNLRERRRSEAVPVR